MDPNETLRTILSVFSQERGSLERDTAISALDALKDWLSKGGFPPAVVRLGCNVPGWIDYRVKVF